MKKNETGKEKIKRWEREYIPVKEEEKRERETTERYREKRSQRVLIIGVKREEMSKI